jgi:hypothetical protein
VCEGFRADRVDVGEVVLRVRHGGDGPPVLLVLLVHGHPRTGATGPTGAAALDHPSIALPLPNGDVLATDDHNDRVIVVDPRSNRIVWQYGHKGIPGGRLGYLDNPDGVDLTGRQALLANHPASDSNSGVLIKPR